MKIKKGYWVKITTWENDTDNYQTEEVQGLTSDDVNRLIEICKLHKSKNDFSNGDVKSFGNMYDPSESELSDYVNAIKSLIASDHENFLKLFGLDDWVLDDDEEIIDGVREYLYDLGLTGGEFYTRVFSGIDIFDVPVDIEIVDVTSKFYPNAT